MWIYPSRPTSLLAAAYRSNISNVLVFDTARVVEIYGEGIRLTGMNTGATILPSPPGRRVIYGACANLPGQAAL